MQVHMRSFRDGDTIVVEPWRAKAFPVIKDPIAIGQRLTELFRLAGIFRCGPVRRQKPARFRYRKKQADKAFDAGACIGCGACVAACPNGSAMFFTSAKVSHLNSLPAR